MKADWEGGWYKGKGKDRLHSPHSAHGRQRGGKVRGGYDMTIVRGFSGDYLNRGEEGQIGVIPVLLIVCIPQSSVVAMEAGKAPGVKQVEGPATGQVRGTASDPAGAVAQLQERQGVIDFGCGQNARLSKCNMGVTAQSPVNYRFTKG